MHMQIAFGTTVFATSVASALLAMLIASYGIARKRDAGHAALMGRPDDRTIFLFEGATLADASPSALAFFNASPPSESDWERLVAELKPDFPDMETEFDALDKRGRIDLMSPDLSLVAETFGKVVRIELLSAGGAAAPGTTRSNSRLAEAEELSGLREVVALGPSPAWRLDGNGALVWANRSYMRLAARSLGVDVSELAWPLPVLFPKDAGTQPGLPTRVSIVVRAAPATLWFDMVSYPTANGVLHFAVSCDSAVRAEAALRGFVQTLTKTFADLPIGLAVFDRKRQLALFNPALVDLTQIGGEFLSARPTLFAFLDRLREIRMIPELKDYPNWRESMSDLEKRAATGAYDEAWTLPTGQTYRVIGRPHPDGAVAFLFEDISAETSLTRRFRSELELGQNALDSFDEAVAIFSPAGHLVVSNAAYASLWNNDPGQTISGITVQDSVRLWSSQSQGHNLWLKAGDFVSDIDAEAPDPAQVELADGRVLSCRFRRLPGGSALVGFRTLAPERLAARTLRKRARTEADVAQAVL